ncbi:MAG TPA: hypothetical protein VE074_06005 [Jatrophihabitantaceae bacterium]|nr:hypothetical protein [Jatrophihabitantaceae bacterium]
MRSEDDLRAAFTAKADDAPAADQVLRAVRRAASRRPDRRRWLVPVIGVAAAAAVGVPLALAVSHSSNTSSRKAGSGNLQTAAGGRAAGSANDSSAGAAGSAAAKPNAPGPNPSALCSPDDVSVSVRREAGEGALLVTSRGPACRMARVPSLSWPSGSTTFGTQSDDSQEKRNPANFGVLPVHGFATARVRWHGCGLPSGMVVYVDWGNGPVKVTVAAAPSPAGCATTPTPSNQPLVVSPLNGLS